MLAATAFCVSCSAIDDDWLVSEVPSPDGARVARLWCEHLCNVPGRLTLTVSPVSRDVARTPSAVSGFPPSGQMPDEDVAGHITMPATSAGERATMLWTEDGGIDISAPCVTQRGPAGGAVKVTIRMTGSCSRP